MNKNLQLHNLLDEVSVIAEPIRYIYRLSEDEEELIETIENMINDKTMSDGDRITLVKFMLMDLKLRQRMLQWVTLTTIENFDKLEKQLAEENQKREY